MLLLSGIAYTIFGIFLMLFPGDGALGLVWAIGFYAVMAGTWLMVFSFRLKNLAPASNEFYSINATQKGGKLIQ